jgi:hypothetical protein
MTKKHNTYHYTNNHVIFPLNLDLKGQLLLTSFFPTKNETYICILKVLPNPLKYFCRFLYKMRLNAFGKCSQSKYIPLPLL